MPYGARLSTYGGDGFYVDLLRDRNGTIKIVEDLQKDNWIRKGTRIVFIELTIYNTNTDLYAGMLILLFAQICGATYIK
nr:unnamed protein product [Callosobruchus analis]